MISRLIAILVCGLAFACKQGQETQPGGTQATGETSTATNADTSGPPTALEGNWALPCGTFGSAANPQSYTTGTKTFKGTRITVFYTTYEDEDCTRKLTSFRTEGSFKLGKAEADGTMPLDVTPSKSFWTAHSKDTLDNYNAEKVCGGGFVLDQEKFLEKAVCGSSDAFKKTFTTSYGLVRIDGDQLFEGDVGPAGAADDGTGPDRRPTRVRARAMFRN